MSRRDPHLPERLRAEGATELERRLLGAASREQPPRELSERMAGAIGVAPPALDVTSGPTGTETVAPKAVAASNALLPWITGAVVTALIAGAIIYSSTSSPWVPPSPSITPASAPQAAPVPAPDLPAEVSSARGASGAALPASPPVTTPRGQPAREATKSVDLSDQIALVDAARGALSSGAGDRALLLLQKYQERYPTGSFRPEATALRVEALVKVGRHAEARALAERFVRDHAGSQLAVRVARVAGLKP